MELIKENRGEIIILHISGYMIADKIDSLKQVIGNFFSSNVNKVVLNLQKVKMTDSSGIGAIVFMLKRFRIRGGDVKIACANGNVAEIFHMIRLHKAVDMYSSVKEAAEAFF